MDPQYSVLLYSKFSSNSQKLLGMINSSGANFASVAGLQILCIDNSKVRQRVLSNKKLDIKTVPCILSIYANGSVEKYDGSYAFQWVKSILEQIDPPKPPPPPQIQLSEPEPEQNSDEDSDNDEPEFIPPPKPRKKSGKQKIPSRMKPVKKEDSGITSIGNIPYDEDDIPRHRNIPQPKRLQQGGGQYIEDDELFTGDTIEHRREPGHVIRDTSSKTQEDPHGTLARMREIEKERNQLDTKMNPPSQRPITDRRP